MYPRKIIKYNENKKHKQQKKIRVEKFLSSIMNQNTFLKKLKPYLFLESHLEPKYNHKELLSLISEKLWNSVLDKNNHLNNLPAYAMADMLEEAGFADIEYLTFLRSTQNKYGGIYIRLFIWSRRSQRTW